jgi:hypothetical protein
MTRAILSNRWQVSIAVLAIGTIGLPGQPALAQDASDGWTLDVTSYGWLTAMNGTVGAGSTRAPVDISFTDTIETVDSILAFSGHVEAKRGPVALFIDGFWTRLGVDDVTIGSGRADVTATSALVELGGAYRLMDRGYDARQPGGWSLEALGGGRYTYLDTKIDVQNGRSADSKAEWVDPFVGLRLRLALAPRWDVSLRGDIGGWGIGSQFTWNVQALVGYRFTLFGKEATALIGYRALSQDFASAKLVWDMTLHGPVIGLNLRF